MWLILCDDGDASAQWFRAGLVERSVPVELVTTSLLSAAVRWDHRVDSDGASLEVDLPDGRHLDSRSVGATLNRVTSLSPPARYFASPDGDYALQELLALYLSVLQCLPGPVLNRPSAQGLSGRMRYVPEWLVLAARAGFVTAPHTVSTASDDARGPSRPAGEQEWPTTDLLVAAGRVFGPAAGPPAAGPTAAGPPVAERPRVAAAARRLSELAGADILGIRVETTPDAVRFGAVDARPDLSLGGDALLDHLAGLSTAGVTTRSCSAGYRPSSRWPWSRGGSRRRATTSSS